MMMTMPIRTNNLNCGKRGRFNVSSKGPIEQQRKKEQEMLERRRRMTDDDEIMEEISFVVWVRGRSGNPAKAPSSRSRLPGTRRFWQIHAGDFNREILLFASCGQFSTQQTGAS
mmetsp:Transcript_5787/g.21849  ORF Transcript_5787/g.21849 Transcript_5787/m.21849 type:complete len:114 (+) Transcript_5787:1261-1602(+)